MKTKKYWGFVLAVLCSVYLSSCCKPEFVSISPEQVKRGDTNVHMVLTTKCTFFKEGEVEIAFIPYVITVHDITVEDQTTLSFLIDVPLDAPLGVYIVSAIFDDGNQAIFGINELEMLE